MSRVDVVLRKARLPGLRFSDREGRAFEASPLFWMDFFKHEFKTLV